MDNRRKALYMVVTALLAVGIGLCSARLCSAGLVYSENPLAGLMLGSERVAGLICSDPLGIMWEQPIVQGSFAVAALIVAVAMVSGMVGAFKGRYDTGREHGAERLATMEEAAGLMDRRHLCNNIIYSEHSGIVVNAYNKRLRECQAARNMNCYTIGTSGLGKTYHLAIPDILQSVGDALTPVRPGPLNIIEHITGRPRKPIVNSRRDPRIGGGYDIIHTDPKGENLLDTGNLLAAAGVDVKVFDTVGFTGLKYNPLAYIMWHETDSKPAEEVSSSVEGRVWAPELPELSHEFASAGENALTERHTAYELNNPEQTSYRVRCEATYRVLDEAQAQRLRCYEILGKPEGERSEADVAYLRAVEYLSRGTAPVASAEDDDLAGRLIGDIEYRRTYIDYEIVIENYALVAQDATVVVHLDRNVTPASDDAVTIDGHYRAVDARAEDDDITISVRGIPPYERGSDANMVVVTLRCTIAPFRVPDGVALTKTVECLVANLKTDDSSQSSQDPFWEDTKRLCLMSLIAYAMEVYDDPRHWTLPVCMDLLDLATPENNDMSQPSVLAMLMRRWEHGEYREPVTEAQGRSQRSGERAQGGRIVRAANVPHSKSTSLALHCYNAFASGAPETVQSVIVTCQAAFVNLLAPAVRRMLSADELHLETLGDAGQAQALFVITKDTDSPYDFLTALLAYQALDLTLDKANNRYGGRLPRHVRFILDEAMTIGKIPILTRAIAVVRSRNISISMFMQSRAQAELVYGELEATVLFDNCSTMCFLGSNSPDVLEEMSSRIGEETIYARITNRTYSGATTPQSVSESIQSQGRAVLSVAQLRKMPSDEMVVQISGREIIKDKKYRTNRHPYYCYVTSRFPRGLFMPIPRFS